MVIGFLLKGEQGDDEDVEAKEGAGYSKDDEDWRFHLWLGQCSGM
jgi:hypothetical protein